MTNFVYNFIFETTPRKRTRNKTDENKQDNYKTRKLLKTKQLTIEPRTINENSKQTKRSEKQNQQFEKQKPTPVNYNFESLVTKLKNSSYRKQIRLLPDQLPQDQGKPTLCLDMDQTLIYASFEPLVDYDFVTHIAGSSDQIVYVKKRPHLESFLKRCSELFEVVIYTASDPRYASPIIDKIDPTGEYIRHRLYRNCCWGIHDTYFLKDLSILNRDTSKIILVDDSPISFLLNPENALQVLAFGVGINKLKDFYSHDKELLRALFVLENLYKLPLKKNENTQTINF
ncbi:nuclear lim interactor-interacting factor-related [Anaeramoeba flamelloides]|uniref:Nuclear lim interactor-interacting factor-related n=1 Tax=Anaeramoeba flamelloides TaxID=1746091 RepID=A0AAV8A2T3_9EUKA|nr:nuclear lim interactor-interacting factor-related [Anaeramoeba flamelloides]KAJ6246250.1 nuclear lim interactor-interacting factor-related [Anaeramoeba flamelloides]